MNKLGFLLVAAGALALSACGKNNTDQLNETEAQNVEANSLNDLAANAANAEMEALGTPAQQNEAENAANAVEDNADTNDSVKTDPSKVEDDVQGM
ncbi:MAG TPA: hypothetical protein VGE68_07435 [Sphingomicrobium sp.]